jgi:hypothetical protein
MRDARLRLAYIYTACYELKATPPASIKTIVDAIATTRNVTLYKETK